MLSIVSMDGQCEEGEIENRVADLDLPERILRDAPVEGRERKRMRRHANVGRRAPNSKKGAQCVQEL